MVATITDREAMVSINVVHNESKGLRSSNMNRQKSSRGSYVGTQKSSRGSYVGTFSYIQGSRGFCWFLVEHFSNSKWLRKMYLYFMGCGILWSVGHLFSSAVINLCVTPLEWFLSCNSWGYFWNFRAVCGKCDELVYNINLLLLVFMVSL